MSNTSPRRDPLDDTVDRIIRVAGRFRDYIRDGEDAATSFADSELAAQRCRDAAFSLHFAKTVLDEERSGRQAGACPCPTCVARRGSAGPTLAPAEEDVIARLRAAGATPTQIVFGGGPEGAVVSGPPEQADEILGVLLINKVREFMNNGRVRAWLDRLKASGKTDVSASAIERLTAKCYPNAPAPLLDFLARHLARHLGSPQG